MTSITGKDSGIPGNDGPRIGPIEALKAVFDHPDIKGDVSKLVEISKDKAKWDKFITGLPEGVVEEVFEFAVGTGHMHGVNLETGEKLL